MAPYNATPLSVMPPRCSLRRAPSLFHSIVQSFKRPSCPRPLVPHQRPPSTVLSRMFIASMGKTFYSWPGRPPHSQPIAQAVGNTTSHRGLASQRADGHGGGGGRLLALRANVSDQEVGL